MVNNVIGMTNVHELLKVIDFSNNRIQEISSKAFHKASNVDKLILDHNDLSISGEENHPGMFANFANLTVTILETSVSGVPCKTQKSFHLGWGGINYHPAHFLYRILDSKKTSRFQFSVPDL